MTPKFTQLLRHLLIFPPLASLFLGLPAGLAFWMFMRFAQSTYLLPLWLNAGIPGFIFGVALPALIFQFFGAVIGFCIGIFVFSRFMRKEQLLFWLLEGKQIRGYSKFVESVVKLAYK